MRTMLLASATGAESGGKEISASKAEVKYGPDSGADAPSATGARAHTMPSIVAVLRSTTRSRACAKSSRTIQVEEAAEAKAARDKTKAAIERRWRVYAQNVQHDPKACEGRFRDQRRRGRDRGCDGPSRQLNRQCRCHRQGGGRRGCYGRRRRGRR